MEGQPGLLYTDTPDYNITARYSGKILAWSGSLYMIDAEREKRDRRAELRRNRRRVLFDPGQLRAKFEKADNQSRPISQNTF